MLGASSVRVQISGERVQIDISHLVLAVAVAVAVVMCQAVVAAATATVIVRIRRKHRQFPTRVTNERVLTPMTHITNNLHVLVVYKILKKLHQLAFGQLHISIVQDRQIQQN